MYTLDAKKQLIVANWFYNSDSGLNISECRPINYKNAMEKYTMPFEYLLAFLIDGEDIEFTENLAQLAIDSEIVIAVQDKVTTTQTVVDQLDENGNVMYDGQGNKLTYVTTSENCTPTIELTYADCWFVKFYKDQSYSTENGKIVNDSESNGSTIINQYVSGESHVEGNEKKFIEIFKNSQYAINTIEPEWLYELLEQNSKTANMVELTKYLFACVKDEKNIGDEDLFDFSVYEDNKFYNVGGVGRVSYESINITEEEKEILCKITYAERGGGTQEQQEYVVSVILNRVLSSSFPNTVKEVVFQPGQFEPTSNNAYNNAVPTQTTRNAVENVINNGDTSKCAIYFMTPAASLRQNWLSNCIFLFNDEDDSLRYVNKGGTHNFYTTTQAQQELKQYIKEGAVSGKVADIIETAKSKLGCNYVWGAHGPNTFDCTGFIEWVYKQNGITVPWYTEAYKPYLGTEHEIDLNEIQPGDILIVFNDESPKGIGHGAIYLGDDEYIHCSGNVHISNLSSRQNGGGGTPFTHAFRFS